MRTRSARRGVKSFSILLLMAFAPALFAQCASRTWDSPWQSPSSVEAAAKFESLIPAGMTERFTAKLTENDWFVAYATAGARTKDNPQDGGLLFIRNGQVLTSQSLLDVPAWKKFARDVGPADLPTFSVFAAQLCQGSKRVVVLGFSACCSAASAVLYMTAIPEGDTYMLAALPVVGGGRLEVFPGSPIKLRLWSGREDGKCEQCDQHFDQSEYELRDSEPVLLKKAISTQMYKPGDFAAHRIVLLPAEK